MSGIPQRSPMCTRDQHGRCPHWAGARMTARPWRRPRREMLLCPCPCHADCALAGQAAVAPDVWAAGCTCPGSVRARASFERRREVQRIAAELDMADHPDAVEIESRLRAVFEEHGQPAPPGMTTWSRVLAAGSARRGTRTLRMAGIGVRGVLNTLRWSVEPSSGSASDARRQTRGGYRAAGAVAAVGMLLTVVAVLSTGWRRIAWGAAACLAWLVSGYAVTLVSAIAQVSRAAESHARAQNLPSR